MGRASARADRKRAKWHPVEAWSSHRYRAAAERRPEVASDRAPRERTIVGCGRRRRVRHLPATPPRGYARAAINPANRAMRPTHVSDVLLSNWQSCVAKLARPPDQASADLSRPPVDYGHPRIAATAVAVHAVEQAALGRAVDLLGAAERHAKAALDFAMALVGEAADDFAARAEEFARYGTHDPFWAECITEFVEHYALTRHGAVPYAKWHQLTDFVLPPGTLPARCRVAVISDWGTGEARAQRLLEAVAAEAPDIVVHLGDIYYACTSAEANAFYANVTRAFGADGPRIFTLCGNHDMYSGAAPYYALLGRLGQPASFFCLRNAHWQVLAADTGYNDFKPWQAGSSATWLRDRDAGETYSELDWHKDKLVNAAGRRTVMFTHHPLFTRNSSISRRAVNVLLQDQLRDFIPKPRCGCGDTSTTSRSTNPSRDWRRVDAWARARCRSTRARTCGVRPPTSSARTCRAWSPSTADRSASSRTRAADCVNSATR